MADNSWDSLVTQLTSHKIGRRQFMARATAAGFSATAIVGAMVGMRATPARAQDTRTVTFWTGSIDPDLTTQQNIVDTYNAQAQGHQAELVQIPPGDETDVTKLMTAVRGGTGPDVYLLDRFTVAQRAGDGLLQDLGQFPGAADNMANYIEFARNEATFQGTPYALPFDTDARALYYNKTMIQNAGFDPAELDASNGPITWDRLAEIANAMNVQDNNGNYTQMGFVPWNNQGWHYTYGFSWGGSFYDPAACQVTPDDPPIVEAFQWVQDYCNALDANKVSAFGSPSDQPGFANQQHPFVIQTMGMVITGDWQIALQEAYAPEVDYGITWIPIPSSMASNAGAMATPAGGSGGSTTWAGGWSLVMPQGAKNPEDGWSFMKWAAGPEGQTIYTRETKHLPTWEALLSDASLFEERHLFFTQLLPVAKSRPVLPVGSLYWNELTSAWQKVYLNQEAPADALASVKETVNDSLQDFCPLQ
jgi:multiple sugar transport system substrate-binding protein